jgi:cytochrome c-type biogenesis protein CcmH/NrfG
LLLLAAALLPLLVGVARRALREPPGTGQRPLLAAAFAALLAWAIHAGVDWDWEMPAVTLPVLALAAAALGRSSARQPRPAAPTRTVVPRALLPVGAVALVVMPLAAALSQSRLDDALAAMHHRRCGPAVSAALDADAALPVRAEPWEVIGYCRSRLGLGRAAIGALQTAVDRDPHNWEVHYGLALVTAAAGGDPRPAARAALELNPKEPIVQNAVASFAARNRAHWRAEALRAPLPVPP